jgi:formylglycine-generating enzyme required for sulfatase activity
VSVGNFSIQKHEVSSREFAAHVRSLSPAEQDKAKPLQDQMEDDSPVVWVSYERAKAFCHAISAALPWSIQWTSASTSPLVTAMDSGVQEWVTDISDGLATVRGPHTGMGAAEAKKAMTEPLLKMTEAAAGPGAAKETIASATIGFRCAK